MWLTGVLAGGRFHAHRAVRRDEAVGAVPAADGAVVTLLGGRAGRREVDGAFLVVVGGVDFDVDLAVRVLGGEVGDELAYVVDGLDVVVDVVDVAVDHRGGDGHVDNVAFALAHELDVLSEFGVVVAVARAVEGVLGFEDDLLRLGERGVADAETRVVRHRDLLGLLAEDVLQVAGAFAEFHVDDDVRANVESGDVLVEVLAGGAECGRVDGNLLPIVLFRRTADNEEIDWFDNLAAAKGGCRGTSNELRLVRVVVENLSDTVEIEIRECPGDAFGDTVTDGVRVPDSLPFDNFDLLVLDRALVGGFEADVSVGHCRVYPAGGSITCGNLP
ncbi:hypothetical protein BM92_00415 [Haloferax mediterranei ATCC 33500]|uniref:Uncharacterized protein n=1 Tax=Haloferax mediterranei (strain ATCC 33500 / DSM 1411 / JCM 8866 / NBRC 14739 / NCIMB 2177 / R-4) TaxID=523841 RepID=A0A059TMR3_HALMT|nr:hypothetical protein BM92_00415 [Haloferax mediterranei ATCC 33500]